MSPQENDDLTPHIAALKSILESSQMPHLLDQHPWTKSPVVQDWVANDPSLQAKTPGDQLLHTLSGLFKELMPNTPPRKGKRLDTRWGQFGTLAAQYFAPFVYGSAAPKSLRDTWETIDQSISLFVFAGQPESQIDKNLLAQYKVVGDDLAFTPKSTVSDWSRGGLKSLAEVFLQHEQRLLNAQRIPTPTAAAPKTRKTNWLGRSIALVLLSLFLILIALFGIKAWGVYELVKAVERDALALQNISPNIIYDQKQLDSAAAQLDQLEKDLQQLHTETAPVAGFAEYLNWVPSYGEDIASAPNLLELATNLTRTAQSSFRGVRPILTAVTTAQERPSPGDLAKLLQVSQPDFEKAQGFLTKALAVRAQIDPDKLSPRLQDILRNRIDPLLPLLTQGLHAVVALPKLLGASNDGPKTYLLLIQNEDELRPSGGFITAVGTVVIKNGEIISYNIESSDFQQEDLSKLYPLAPWQLEQYMDSSILVLRDANWYVDFPTAASWVEELYAYKHSFSVDGLIAFDQQFVSLLLKITGPVDVPGIPYPVTAENVFEYLRNSKVEFAAGKPLDRKAFLNDLTKPLLKKLLSGKGLAGKNLLDTFYLGLNQHHLLLQLDDPNLASLMAERNWDGAIRPGNGDFLMVIDSNVGFNKVNSLIDTKFTYQVDLTDLTVPKTALVVQHKNNVQKNVPCIQWGLNLPADKDYPIERCYWDYMRVYLPAGAELLDAKPQAIPATAMILKTNVPARVDVLDPDDEQLGSIPVQGFGTLLLVPTKTTRESPFTFALPARIVIRQPDSSYIYRLVIRKQPGTGSIPLDLQISLPASASILSFSKPLLAQGGRLIAQLGLQEDMTFEVHFKLK